MSAWLGLVGPLVVAGVLLVVPGLLVGLGLGLRGTAALGSAPLLSTAVVAVASTAAPLLGLAWTPALLAVATVLAAALAVLVGTLLRRLRRPVVPVAETRRAWVCGLAGAAAGGLATFLAGLRGIGRPDAVSQTFDAVFHLNALRFVLQTHDASSLDVNRLAQPGATHAFYPAVWHAVAAQVAMLTGAGPVRAANALSLAIAAVAWPLGVTFLVRQVVGPRALVVAAGGLLSGGMLAFPFALQGFGVLWPNLLGFAVLPAALALAMGSLGFAESDPTGAWRSLVVLAAGLPGLALAHPNSLFSLVLLVAVLAVVSGLPVVAGWWARGARLRAVLVVVLPLAAAWLVKRALDSSSVIASVTKFDWKATETMSQAFGEAVVGTVPGAAPEWVLSALVAVGLVVALRARRLRWLAAAWAVSVGMYSYAAGVDTPLSQALTGYWYNDPFRLDAVVAMLRVPLATLGCLAVAVWLRDAVDKRRPAWSLRIDRAARGYGGSTSAALLVVLGLVLVTTSGLYQQDHAARIAYDYDTTEESGRNLVTPPEQAFVSGLGRIVPADAVVANDPWDGSALLYALTGRRVLFPALAAGTTADQNLVAAHLDEAASDPAVCDAVRRLGIRYVLLDAGRFWPWDPRGDVFGGIEGVPGSPGFVPVASADGNTLYEVRACGPVPPAPPGPGA